MSDKIITEIVLEGEKEAIASIQRVGKAADATFADLQNVQLNFDFIEPQKGLKSLTDAGQRFASSMKNTGNIVTNVFAGISSAFRNAGTIGGGVFSELTRSLQATSLMAKTGRRPDPAAWQGYRRARAHRRYLGRRHRGMRRSIRPSSGNLSRPPARSLPPRRKPLSILAAISATWD